MKKGLIKNNKIGIFVIFFFIISLFLNLNGYTEENEFNEENLLEFKFKGTYKNLFLFQKTDNYYGNNVLPSGKKNLLADMQRVRFSPEITYGENFVFYMDFDNEVVVSNYNKSREFNTLWKGEEFNDLFHLSWNPYHGEDLFCKTKIHRIYLKYSVDDFTLSVGRQQVRFGTGRLWNPLDILNPISPTSIEGGEDQSGTDVIRLDYYPGDLSELSVVFNPKRKNDSLDSYDYDSSNYLARYRLTVRESDFAFLGGLVAKRAVFGHDFSTIVYDGSLRGAIIYSKPENSTHFWQANVGYEYTFKNGIYFLFEQFYNQKSLNNESELKNKYLDYSVNGWSSFNYYSLTNRIITYNRHYSGLALGYDFHPLVRGDQFLIYDIEGTSLFSNSSIKINLLENLDFSIGVLMGKNFKDGKESEFNELDNHYLYTASLKAYF